MPKTGASNRSSATTNPVDGERVMGWFVYCTGNSLLAENTGLHSLILCNGWLPLASGRLLTEDMVLIFYNWSCQPPILSLPSVSVLLHPNTTNHTSSPELLPLATSRGLSLNTISYKKRCIQFAVAFTVLWRGWMWGWLRMGIFAGNFRRKSEADVAATHVSFANSLMRICSYFLIGLTFCLWICYRNSTQQTLPEL